MFIFSDWFFCLTFIICLLYKFEYIHLSHDQFIILFTLFFINWVNNLYEIIVDIYKYFFKKNDK